MAILRFTASADNTITNAFEADLTDRGTGSNMGYADALEVFSIYGQVSSSANGQSQELSRAIIQFPITSISASRTAGTIPASGNVGFYLRMYNARTPFTLPQGFNLVLAPVSRSWTEGTGLDMDEYVDQGPSNWISSSTGNPWDSVGGDYLDASNYNISFPEGFENIELDVSQIVEQWIAGTYNNYGFGLRLTASQEAYYSSSTGLNNGNLIHNPQGAQESNYTKKFFSRSTEFFYNRPVIEARWDSRVADDRENFYYSSSLAPADENLNSLYYYNYIRGRLIDYNGTLRVRIYSSSVGAPVGGPLTIASPAGTAVTATKVSTGIYKVELALTAATTPLTAMHDVWSDSTSGEEFVTASFYPEKFRQYDVAPTFNRVTSCRNLKKSYSTSETARFRFFVRDKEWSPTVYTVATANNPTEVITSGSYNIRRVVDDLNAIPYGTGSNLSTYMSYDKDGNYFDLDMSMLEPGYMYQLKLAYYNDSIGSWQEQPQTFKFRVEE